MLRTLSCDGRRTLGLESGPRGAVVGIDQDFVGGEDKDFFE